MLGIGVPHKVKTARLTKWYESMGEQDRVKLNRYLDFADDRGPAEFLTTVVLAAVDDHNYKFGAKIADTQEPIKDPVLRYDFNEAAILAYFNTDRFDDCLKCCEEGLALLKDPAVKEHVVLEDGTYPEAVNCRNYMINVVVGVKKDYDAADGILDGFVQDGLITQDEAKYRKDSIKTYRLERTFEGIFSGKPQ